MVYSDFTFRRVANTPLIRIFATLEAKHRKKPLDTRICIKVAGQTSSLCSSSALQSASQWKDIRPAQHVIVDNRFSVITWS